MMLLLLPQQLLPLSVALLLVGTTTTVAADDGAAAGHPTTISPKCTQALAGCWPVKSDRVKCDLCEARQARHLHAVGCTENDIRLYCAPAQATTFYVSSATGNDAAAGTSQGAPWKSLRRASEQLLGLGDQLLLRRGDLWRAGSGLPAGATENVGLWLQGAKGATVSSYGNASLPQPRVEVLNAANWTACVKLSDCNATTIRGLSLAACSVGIKVEQQLLAGSHNHLFESNFISDIRGPIDAFKPGPGAGSGWGAAFQLAGPVGSTHNLTVRNNIMTRIDTFFYNPGIKLTGALLESNTMAQCGYNCMQMGRAEAMMVRNNVFLRDTPPKMFIYGTTDIILGDVDGVRASLPNR